MKLTQSKAGLKMTLNIYVKMPFGQEQLIPPPLSPPLCDEAPDDPGGQDQAGSEHSDHCQEAQHVPVATLVTTA